MKKLSPAFLTAVALSLAGFANLGFAERYHQLAVQTDDTAAMGHSTALAFRQYSQPVQVNDGEVAYIAGSFAAPRSNATYEYAQFNPVSQSIALIELKVDFEKLDDNATYPITGTDVAIPGPCTIWLSLRPAYKRQSKSYDYNYENEAWQGAHGNWDFGASHGSASIRIIGTEQEASKKFATVIPENSSGNVDIILEQSTDLINWSAVNPGSFPPSTAKRFFRVRSQE